MKTAGWQRRTGSLSSIGRVAALLFSLTLALFLPLSLLGCGMGGPSPAERMRDFCERYDGLPAGRVYRSGSEEWEEDALPREMADLLFREDTGENAFSLCEEYAILLSSGYGGGEIAFLRCRNGTDAKRVEEMCSARIARVRQILPDSPICRGACVLRRGNDVVLLLLPDNEAARALCLRQR